MIGSSPFTVRKKVTPVPRLNLVSMIDILTILVFFLLLNQGEIPKIQNAKYIELPKSVSGVEPHAPLLISINQEQIWIGDQKISSVDEILKAPEKVIEPLAEALANHKAGLGDLSELEKLNGLRVTIMGEKYVPYAVLKSVMATCQGKDFRSISLAVNQVIGEAPKSESITNLNALPKVGG